MRQRGRKPSATVVSLTATATSSILTPPAHLSDAERLVFDQTVRSVSDGHFVKCDGPMLAAYAQCLIKAREAADVDPEAWAKLVRLQIALARSLRLTVQSRAAQADAPPGATEAAVAPSPT